MSKHIRKIMASVLFCSLIIAGGCSTHSADTENSAESSSGQQQSEYSEPDVNSEISNTSDIVDTSSDITDTEPSDDSSESDDVESEISTEQSIEESTEDSSDTEDESSYVNTPDESSAAEISIDGYQFDDEQIVSDYHTATVFTSNDEFNEIFSQNALDTQYNTEQQLAGTSNEMRQLTLSYSGKWKAKATEIFTELDNLLADNPEEHDKLIQSQDEWTAGLGEAESSFYSEASGTGTEGLIAAEAAVMNYYKGRAAILLEQIYELNGEIDLSRYGL